MLETRNVKDFKGNLISRNKARRIDGQYYEEGVTCILMSDGQWYRTTTDKIKYDWENKTWLFSKDADSLQKGLVDDGSLGWYTPTDKNVRIAYKADAFVRTTKLDLFGLNSPQYLEESKPSWKKISCRSEEIATKFEYVESIYDGIFYKANEMTSADRNQALKPGIPSGERSNTYSLDDDLETKQNLQKSYESYNPIIEKGTRNLSRYLPYSFGIEYESSLGFLPARIRSNLGIRGLRDGSISGIEYVTIPLNGVKGLQVTKKTCEELSKRCTMDLKCSVHTHYGNVRRDKAYIISLWTLATKIQDELLDSMPFSRLNSIRGDGKVYCKKLPDLELKPKDLLTTKSAEQYKLVCLREFNKIYSFLNAGHAVGEITSKQRVKEEKVGILAGKEQKLWRFANKIVCYSTKSKTHSIRGHKWDRPQRYYWINLLPTFFSEAGTIEFRPHEGTMNYEKVAMWMLICTSILEYAKDIEKVLSSPKITMSDVLSAYLPKKATEHILAYLKHRHEKFMYRGTYRNSWDDIEIDWLIKDRNFQFNNTTIDSLL